MGKISYENKKGKITITNKISYPESINEQIFKVQESNMLPSVLPITQKQKGKETKLICTVQGMQSLNEYFYGVVSKRKFLETIHQIIFIIKTYEKNAINPSNLDLQKDRVFVNPQTKEIRCVYWPVVNNQSEVPIQAFFKQLPMGVTFDTYEDTSYLREYSNFFNKLAPFSIKEFEKLILKLQGKKEPSGKISPSETLNHKAEPSAKKQDDNKNIAYDPFAVVAEIEKNNNGYTMCPKCNKQVQKGSNFCINCGAPMTKKPPVQPAQPPVYPVNPPVRPVQPPVQPVQPPVQPVQPPVQPVQPPVQPVQPPVQPVQPPVQPVQPPVQPVQPPVQPVQPPVQPVQPPVQPVQPPVQPVQPPVQPVQPPVQPSGSGSTQFSDVNNVGGTVVLNFDDEVAMLPKLVLNRTNSKYVIDKPVYKVGSDVNESDLVISDNKYISRKHIEIITQNDRYYIVDKGSTNKSYVDGRQLVPEVALEIFANTEIKLANEVLTFVVEA